MVTHVKPSFQAPLHCEMPSKKQATLLKLWVVEWWGAVTWFLFAKIKMKVNWVNVAKQCDDSKVKSKRAERENGREKSDPHHWHLTSGCKSLALIRPSVVIFFVWQNAEGFISNEHDMTVFNLCLMFKAVAWSQGPTWQKSQSWLRLSTNNQGQSTRRRHSWWHLRHSMKQIWRKCSNLQFNHLFKSKENPWTKTCGFWAHLSHRKRLYDVSAENMTEKSALARTGAL